MEQLKPLNECCQDEKNHKTGYIMNRFEDYEPDHTFCKVCNTIIAEYGVDR